MRVATGILACVMGGALGVATADEPPKAAEPAATAAPAAAAPSTPAAPATASTAAASSTTPAAAAPKPAMNDEQIEKHFRSEGYTVKTVNGEKQYCKRMEVIGSRLGGGVQCIPEQQLLMRERDDQENLSRAQKTMGHPNGS